MILFLLVYLSIYGGVHLYAFLKLKRGLALGLPAYPILAIFMILMVVAPIFVRISERYGHEAFARGLAYVGFIKYGKFAVTGNHEFYAGLDRALAFTEKAGFTILRGEGITVSNALNVAGVDDPARGSYSPERTVSERALLAKLPQDKFTLFLKHQPVISSESLGMFDLQLSGHTHKGQIFPFNLVTKLYYRTHAGLSKVKGNALLYVSRGSGTWGPPVRFLSPPVVTVIDITYTSGQ